MRAVRVLWIVLFLLPLGIFADRLCYIDLVDPTYHGLLWMHERLGLVFAALALVSAGAALGRFIRIQGQLRGLETLRSAVPPSLADAFVQARRRTGVRTFDLVYIDVPLVFCFAVFGGRVIVSRGFVELIDREDLPFVAVHELMHLRSADPVKALLWHLFFAALIFPGFGAIEEALYQRRERRVDKLVRGTGSSRYDTLLERLGVSSCAGTPLSAFRSLEMRSPATAMQPMLCAAVPLGLLALLLISHLLFMQNLPYLQTHHC